MQGLLLLNKPQGKTSYGAVSAVKKISGEKRVGHTGTLDPMATGVLPVLLGRATALASSMLDSDKKYAAGVKLGITTDTEDITGEVISKREVDITPEKICSVLSDFVGIQMQRPPMYSALKRAGVPLYKLAREGKSVEIPEREINVISLNAVDINPDCGEFAFDAVVSKGTYIRSLVRDIGEELGCGAVLSSLCRTSAAGFDISRCVRLEDLNEDNICDYLLDEEEAVKHLRSVSVTEKQAIRFCNGGQLSFERTNIADPKLGEHIRVKYAGLFLGIGFCDIENQQLGIKCIINYPKVRE